MEYVKLNNGIEMPMEGFGVFQVPDPEVCERSVYDAIQVGYRLIDTAAAYMNEEAVGKAVRRAIADGICKREDLFITTKLWVQDFGYDNAKKAIETCRKNLDLDPIDLILLHQPMGDYYGAYRALEEAYRDGIVRAIGVSNFYPHVITDLCLTVDIIPAVNQIELHPFFQQPKALEVCKSFGIVCEAWGPFAEGNHNIFTHEVLTDIGKQYGKTAAQVALRWNIDRGVVVIPKSIHKDRMEQNFDIWDFNLSQEDINRITDLDVGHSEIVDHTNPEFVKRIHAIKVHD